MTSGSDGLDKRFRFRRRQRLRLRHYDYRENGYYFVTICTKHRTPWFATSQAKCLVQQKMEHIPQFFSGVSIDQAVVMPNHLHVIFVFQSSDTSLGQIVQVLKSWVTRAWGVGHSLWQSNYYDHVIRNDVALNKIRQYIVNNPVVDRIDCEQFYDVS